QAEDDVDAVGFEHFDDRLGARERTDFDRLVHAAILARRRFCSGKNKPRRSGVRLDSPEKLAVLVVALGPPLALIVLGLALVVLILRHAHRLRLRDRCRGLLGLRHGGGYGARLGRRRLRRRGLRLAAAIHFASDRRAGRAADTGADDRAFVAADLVSDRRTGAAADCATEDRSFLALAARRRGRADCAAGCTADDGAGLAADMLADRRAAGAADAAPNRALRRAVPAERRCHRE